jgi:hypothetical protein
MHKYLHIVDENGCHWLKADDGKSYFNGAFWVAPPKPIAPAQELGEVTIEGFLEAVRGLGGYERAD